MVSRHCQHAVVVLFAVLICGTSFSQEAPKKEKPVFAAGEKVEVWWAGKFLPGEIVTVEGNGWVQVKFATNGREQTIRQKGDGEWVRKLAVAKPAAVKPTAGTTPASTPATPAATPAGTPNFGGKPAGAPGDANPFATPEEAAMRTWTDATGKFKIEATFAGKEGGNVLLTRADGKTIKLALAKLSKEDQDHVAGLDAKPMPENPFDTAPQVAAPQNVAGGIDRDADYSTTEQVLPQPLDGWSLIADAAAPPAEAIAPRAIGLTTGGGNERFFETPSGLVFDAAKGQAIAVLVNGPPGKEREVRFIRADLKTGKPAGEVTVNSSFTPFDLSPSGELVACLPDTFARNETEKNKVAIFRLDPNGLVPVIRWKMGEGVEFAKKFERLHFIGEDKLLAIAPFGNSVTLFQIDQAKALWSLKTAGNCLPALSANRAQFAAVVEGGIGIFSTANAETLGRIATPPINGGVLAMSPDGTRLAHCTNTVINTWDLTTGKALHEVWFPKHLAANSVDWVGGNFVLVDRQHLVDLDKRIILWRYDLPPGAQPVSRTFGGRLWLLTGGHNNPFQLFAATVPDAAAIAKGANLTADGVLALKPGAQVSIKLDLARAKPEDAQKAKDALTQRLVEQGMTVADGAPLVLEAVITDGGKEKANYRNRPGFFGGGEEIEVQKEISTVTLKENDKVLWTATRHYGAPHMLRYKEGQTLEQAVQEQRGIPASFFFTVQVPRYLARHEQDACYGSSKLAP